MKISLIYVGHRIAVPYHLYSKRKITETQYVFTTERSTTDAIKKVVDIIEQHKTDDQNIRVISLDVKSAFKNMWWSATLAELGTTDCPANLYLLPK